MFAMVEDNKARPRVVRTHYAGVLDRSRHLPPRLPGPIDNAFSGYCNVGRIGCAHQRLQPGLAKLGFGRIVRKSRGTKQRRSLVELKNNVVLQHNWGAQVGPGGEPDRAAALTLAGVDRRLNRGCILRDSVALCSKFARIALAG